EKEKKPVSSYIDLITQLGVDFSPRPEDEQEIRRSCKYLGKKGLDELLLAIRSNQRLPQAEPTTTPQISSAPEPDPKITGGINLDSFVLPVKTPERAYIVLNVHVANSGGATMIQNYRTKFLFYNQEMEAKAIPCSEFRLVKKIDDKDVSQSV